MMMVKKLLLFSCMMLPLLVFSQGVERANVLIEVCTGTW